MAQIGPYNICEQLGHGGSGTVHRAEVTADVEALGLKKGDSVAVKLLLPKVLQDEMIVNVTRLMVENHLNDLPIVDSENKLVGELNGLDILKSSMKHWK